MDFWPGGILRIPWENIFSGLDNLSVNTVMDEENTTVLVLQRNRRNCLRIMVCQKENRA